MKKRIFKGTGLILLLLVLFVLSNAVVITRANEYVLIKQFGKWCGWRKMRARPCASRSCRPCSGFQSTR